MSKGIETEGYNLGNNEVKMETWPLWQCIPVESLVDLIQLQGKTYGTRLELLTYIYRDIESLEEIDRLMRQRPRYKGKVWFGG